MTTTAIHSAVRPRKRRPGAATVKRRTAPYVFVLPFIVIFLAFSVYPQIGRAHV